MIIKYKTLKNIIIFVIVNILLHDLIPTEKVKNYAKIMFVDVFGLYVAREFERQNNYCTVVSTYLLFR